MSGDVAAGGAFPAAGPPGQGEGLRTLLQRRHDGGSTDFEIVLPAEGGAYRTLIGARHRHSIASNRDPQTGWANPTEGVTERDLSRLLTVHPDVVDHQTQPLEIRTSIDAVATRWLVDYWFLSRDGTLEIGEVKIDQSQIGPDYLRKMERMAEIVDRRLGCRFRIRYRRDIVGGPDRQHNVGMLHFDRDTSVERRHLDALRPLEGLPGLTFGDLAGMVEPQRPHWAAGIVRRLVCMGRVWIDIDTLITDDSEVLVRPAVDLRSPLRRH